MGEERESARSQVAGLAFAGTGMASDPTESTIGGTAVGEALFLDEPADYARPAPRAASASPFELFANEDDPPVGSEAADGTGTESTSGTTIAARMNESEAVRPTRPSLLSVYLLVAGIGLIAALTANQGSGLPLVLWSLMGR